MRRTLLGSLGVSVSTTVLEIAFFSACIELRLGVGLMLVVLRWTAGALGAVTNFTLNRWLVPWNGRSSLLRAGPTGMGPRVHGEASIAPGTTCVRAPGQERAGAWMLQLSRYSVVAISAVTLATALWWSLCAVTSCDPRILHPVSSALIWGVFTYPMLRRWVFA